MADRNITVTIKDPLLKDITSFSVTRDANGAFQANVGYALKDATGAVYKTGSCVVVLSAGALTTLGSFLSSNCLATIRAQEGL